MARQSEIRTDRNKEAFEDKVNSKEVSEEIKIEDPDADFQLYLSAETGCDSKFKEDANELGIISTTDPLSSKAGNSPLNIPF